MSAAQIEGCVPQRFESARVRCADRLRWTRRWIVRLDDAIGNGSINAVKTWWTDLEIVDSKVVPPKGTNRRGLAPVSTAAPKIHQIAYYPAAVMPPPDAKTPVPVDRKAALAQAAHMETPAAARTRARGEP